MAIDGRMIFKLQKALKQKGYIITVSTQQYYMYTNNRYVKFYIIKHDKTQLLKTPSQIRVIKNLVAILNALKTAPDNIDNIDDYIIPIIIETEERLNDEINAKKARISEREGI